ncbi:mannitol dehydrogenase family protein [Pseudomonas asuensis]|uniref:D-mannonate oxidoreductase n=1 Tax=Pseudomonas asuensis TaxID=1825787 RepID=A0ABQ2GK89_9PSED|nr:mannitol dehydrogenase family protein [Pseudomonas asuensis]GGM00553.1 D-mannonate oxidoreductase [Pseudomonas asuensis]
MHKIERYRSTYSKPGIGIVHLGLGAFHRAHQAVYIERNLERHGGGKWGVCSANIRSNRALVDQLRMQDCRYHIAEYKDSEHVALREIAAIQEVLYAGKNGEDREVLLERMANPDTRIITLTVTEKGYCLSPATGQLRTDDPGIAHDIRTPHAPQTAPGLLVEALRRRQTRGLAPFTVLCCDNMPDNGSRTRQAVTQLAAAQDERLAAWISETVAFPSSMVDRIVPAMTDASFETLRQLDCEDSAAVIGEAFSQWVVEDHFPQGRPDWEKEGVQMVADVHPFETMKLRMLNGSHSLLAYIGALAGHATVFDAINDPALLELVRCYMEDEAMPTLDMPAGIDLNAYAEDLVARFRNDSLQHRLHQIAMDGSQKLPQRWLSGTQEQLARGGSISCVALGIASWIQYCSGQTAQGSHEVNDPLRETFHELHAHRQGEALVDGFLGLVDVFPAGLVEHAAFRLAVQEAHRVLSTQGLQAALANVTHNNNH